MAFPGSTRRLSSIALIVCALVVVSPLACVAQSASSAPSATPLPKPAATSVLSELFSILHVAADATICVQDVNQASGAQLREFASAVRAKNIDGAVQDLANAMSSLSTSIGACSVPRFQSELTAISAALRTASTDLNGVIKVVVGASNVWTAIEKLASAVESGNDSNIASAIANLLSQWTAVSGGCGSSKSCQMVDGVIRIFELVLSDIGPCESAIIPAVTNITDGASSFASGNYKSGVMEFAAGLDALVEAGEQDACGMGPLVSAIQDVAPKLYSAIVKIDSDGTVHVIVGAADVYDSLYQLMRAVQEGNYAGVGMQLGRLLQELRSTDCKTKACLIVQALLGSSQVLVTDFENCASDLDDGWSYLVDAVEDVEEGFDTMALSRMGSALGEFSQAVNGCGLPKLATDLESVATKLGDNGLAQDIGNAVQLLVGGADVTTHFLQAVADYKSGSWSSFGSDLTGLASLLSSTKCTSFVCKIVEGLLDMAGTAYTDLTACEADLSGAESMFVQGANYWSDKKVVEAIGQWSAGLNKVAQSVSDCGLQTEMKYILHEANVLGIANTTVAGEVVQVILHGANFYEELYSTIQDLESHDFRGAGQQLGSVLNTLSQWTEGHVCTSDFCYVVVGILQFMGDIEGSVKQCEADFENAWANFTQGYEAFSDSHHNIIFHWSHDKDEIKLGVKEIGAGFTHIAQGVSDCHLEEFAELLAKLAAKLGIAPEISWLEELLKIIIDGVDIEEEIGAACTDWGNNNYVGFGYNLAKLLKTLL